MRGNYCVTVQIAGELATDPVLALLDQFVSDLRELGGEVVYCSLFDTVRREQGVEAGKLYTLVPFEQPALSLEICEPGGLEQ